VPRRRPDVVEALARAYLAGRGGDAVIVEVTGPRVTYEVSYRAGDVEGVLVIDALSGDVVEAPGR
jgi:Ni2+-binding GTPase involved in maturation of urease and hydrogenase